jgi:hypothetical protein
MDELLCRDIFPAELALYDRVVTECRVFVTTTRLLAWQVGTAGKIEVAADLDLAEAGGVEMKRDTTQLPLKVETTEGTVFVNKGRGCGCHSPLKALGAPVPWTRQQAARQEPTDAALLMDLEAAETRV